MQSESQSQSKSQVQISLLQCVGMLSQVENVYIASKRYNIISPQPPFHTHMVLRRVMGICSKGIINCFAPLDNWFDASYTLVVSELSFLELGATRALTWVSRQWQLLCKLLFAKYNLSWVKDGQLYCKTVRNIDVTFYFRWNRVEDKNCFWNEHKRCTALIKQKFGEGEAKLFHKWAS